MDFFFLYTTVTVTVKVRNDNNHGGKLMMILLWYPEHCTVID